MGRFFIYQKTNIKKMNDVLIKWMSYLLLEHIFQEEIKRRYSKVLYFLSLRQIMINQQIFISRHVLDLSFYLDKTYHVSFSRKTGLNKMLTHFDEIFQRNSLIHFWEYMVGQMVPYFKLHRKLV